MNAFDCWIPEGIYDFPFASVDWLELQENVGRPANDTGAQDVVAYARLRLVD